MSEKEKITDSLEKEIRENHCQDINYESIRCNQFLLKKELLERNNLSGHESLYPHLDQAGFNVQIALKKEFNDTKYEGDIHENVKEYADILSKAEFEIQPHQAFVKNFLSSQTPYNSLLLYHGLGSGKTCSAIGVSEEMRDYLRQIGSSTRIIIVASENVLDNFRNQLFNENSLKLIEGLWSAKGCVGNKLLKEINPTNMPGIPKEKIISQVNSLINNSYLFLGYGQFANYIINIMNNNNTGEAPKKIERQMVTRLRNEFNERLIVIDEVQNIRKSDDNENKKVATQLEILIKAVKNMRLLLLSATPMYNSYKEIIWLLNLMNMNDHRARIQVKDVFEKNGDFKEGGKELLIRKATGYVSFVRGENPYTFPYRVYPNIFAKDKTFNQISYPNYQMNLKKINEKDKMKILSLFLIKIGECGNCGECQYCAYKYIISRLRGKNAQQMTTKRGVVKRIPTFENMDSFGYTLLQLPLESLIITYPMDGLKAFVDKIPKVEYKQEESPSFSELETDEKEIDEYIDLKGEKGEQSEAEEEEEEEEEEITVSKKKGGAFETFIEPKELTGVHGLERIMKFVDSKNPPEKGSYEYKDRPKQKYGKIFSLDLIGKYSSKIKQILESILKSEGIVLIYSQYIDSGLIPMALALEELGFSRYGDNVKPLFKSPPSELIDARTMKPPENKKDFLPARYSMITGDKRLSPNNNFEVKGLTNVDNKDGNRVKVILISRAGSEGIDFKFIRQVHILEPWYNMNRIEQIIGRAVRNFSHKELPFEKRNVQIFMYGTILEDNQEEAADLYVYRTAEYKAKQIGIVSRILKETSVDCILNHDQTNFSQEIMSKELEGKITQELSDHTVIKDFKIGDAPYSFSCDYMKNCYYDCTPDVKIKDENDLNMDSYNEYFINTNSEKILQKIRMIMREGFFYKKKELIDRINVPKVYPCVQIYASLNQLIEDENEFIYDKYGRTGRLVNVGDYYLFQPLELKNKQLSLFERTIPIDYKHQMIDLKINEELLREKQEETKITTKRKDDVLFQSIKKNFELSKEYIEETKVVDRGDDDWYKRAGTVIYLMMNDYGISREILESFLIEHILDTLLFNDKVEIMNYLYSLNVIEERSFEWYCKNYFINNSIFIPNQFTAYILYDLDKTKIMILDDSNVWREAEPEDIRDVFKSKESKKYTSKITNYNNHVGFIDYGKSGKNLVFKTKNTLLKRNTGARCDESGKSKTMDLINELLGKEKYTNENTKLKKDKKGITINKPLGQIDLCIIQEFLLRYYEKTNKDKKTWFLNHEMAMVHKIKEI